MSQWQWFHIVDTCISLWLWKISFLKCPLNCTSCAINFWKAGALRISNMILRLLGDHSKIAVVIIGTKRGWSDEIQKSRIHQCEFGKKEGSGDLFSPPHVRHTRQPSSVSFSQTATFFSFAKPDSIQIMNETTFMGEGGIFSETIW